MPKHFKYYSNYRNKRGKFFQRSGKTPAWVFQAEKIGKIPLHIVCTLHLSGNSKKTEPTSGLEICWLILMSPRPRDFFMFCCCRSPKKFSFSTFWLEVLSKKRSLRCPKNSPFENYYCYCNCSWSCRPVSMGRCRPVSGGRCIPLRTGT